MVPIPVQDVINWWLPQVREILDEQLQSVILYGSVTLGDFQSGWSDIDVCAVLTESIAEDAGVRIGRVYDLIQRHYLEDKHGGWLSGQVLEGNYIPESLAGDPREDQACYIAGGTTRKWQRGDPLQPFDRYMLANFGQSCFGPEVEFSEPNKDLLRPQAETDLRSLGNWERQSALWLTGMLHWLARSLVFWRDGRMLSKTAALQHEIERGSTYTEAFQLALTIRLEGSANATDHMQDLRSQYTSHVDAFSEELRQFIVE